jgi:hypothetical protein
MLVILVLPVNRKIYTFKSHNAIVPAARRRTY